MKVKAYTDLEQSKKLAEILPLESADYHYITQKEKSYFYPYSLSSDAIKDYDEEIKYIPCWSLAALLNILHSKAKDIPSLSGGGYKDGKYISDWCLDYEFENGDYQKTFASNSIDACYKMIIRLIEQKYLRYGES